MNFLIADTFTDSLARPTGEEQKAVKTTAFDLQMNAAAPGLQFHKLDKSKDRNFWSVRVSRDIRLIVHRTAQSLLLAYVGHHDAAYHWAERRRLEAHPMTGAAQWVELRERVQEVVVPHYVEATEEPKALLFAEAQADDLLRCGVPIEWMDEVRQVTDDELLDLCSHLPAEAAEALLDLATGVVPQKLRRTPAEEEQAAFAEMAAESAPAVYQASMDAIPEQGAPDSEAFDHPDARRRFRTVANVEELERALESRGRSGPSSCIRRNGGRSRKTTAVRLAWPVRRGQAKRSSRCTAPSSWRVRPSTRACSSPPFGGALASALRVKLRRLVGNEPRIAERLEVHAADGIARRLYDLNVGRSRIASREVVRDLLREAAAGEAGATFSLRFLEGEWRGVVDAWQLESWEACRDVIRLGRKTRLPEARRAILWRIFERVREKLSARDLMTQASLLSRLAAHLKTLTRPPFEHVVVDEAQDVSVAQLRFLAALGAGRPNGLFFAGDLGQRICQQPFSWKELGVDVRGRSSILRINYGTSHQIRARADRLLGPELADVDGIKENRRATWSVFNGAEPETRVLESVAAETSAVGTWLAARAAEGVRPEELAVFVRSASEVVRVEAAVDASGLPHSALGEDLEATPGAVSVGTMHLAKGMEFRAVAVIACDDELIPSQERIESIGDDTDLEDAYATERHLLYVACTRARDHLLVTGVAPASEFLDDLRG